MLNSAVTRNSRSRPKILVAAEKIFLLHGFLGANMDMVAETANVSKQTVYAHFKSKEALFIEVVNAMTGEAIHDIGEDVDDVFLAMPVREYLLKVAMDQLTIVLTPRLMQLRRMVIGELERFPEFGTLFYQNGPEKSNLRLQRAFRYYASIGQIKTPNPRVAASQFNWMVMGAPTNAAMFLGDSGIPTHAQLKAHVRECVRVFMCGYSV